MAPVILFHPERPWTANSARAAKHWSVNASRTKQWRTAFHLLAFEAGVPSLGPCRVIVTPHLAKGPTQDVGARAPAAKAAIDGLVDAGVWPDDSPKNVVERPHPVAPPEGFAAAVSAFQEAFHAGGLEAAESLLEERAVAQAAASREATRK